MKTLNVALILGILSLGAISSRAAGDAPYTSDSQFRETISHNLATAVKAVAAVKTAAKSNAPATPAATEETVKLQGGKYTRGGNYYCVVYHVADIGDEIYMAGQGGSCLDTMTYKCSQSMTGVRRCTGVNRYEENIEIIISDPGTFVMKATNPQDGAIRIDIFIRVREQAR